MRCIICLFFSFFSPGVLFFSAFFFVFSFLGVVSLFIFRCYAEGIRLLTFCMILPLFFSVAFLIHIDMFLSFLYVFRDDINDPLYSSPSPVRLPFFPFFLRKYLQRPVCLSLCFDARLPDNGVFPCGLHLLLSPDSTPCPLKILLFFFLRFTLDGLVSNVVHSRGFIFDIAAATRPDSVFLLENVLSLSLYIDICIRICIFIHTKKSPFQ